MTKMMSVAVYLIGMMIVAASAKPVKARDNSVWWRPIHTLITHPCLPTGVPPSPNISSIPHQPEMEDSQSAGKKGCLPLKFRPFRNTAREAQGMVADLLTDKRTRGWTRGHFSAMARKMRCQMDLCVPVRQREGLNKGQTQVTEDLIQLMSFAHYLAITGPTMRGGRNASIRRRTAALSEKLQDLGCALRGAVTKDSLDPYVTPDDVPTDLRRRKGRKYMRVAVYVIWDKLMSYLRELPGSYRKANFKLCKN